jgi:hypothetical protein
MRLGNGSSKTGDEILYEIHRPSFNEAREALGNVRLLELRHLIGKLHAIATAHHP